MPITKRLEGDITVFDISGRIVYEGTDLGIRSAVMEALEEGSGKIVVNLSGVTLIDSAGTGQLVAGFAAVGDRGGQLKFASVPPKVNDILKITKLNTVFEIHEDEAAALASFDS